MVGLVLLVFALVAAWFAVDWVRDASARTAAPAASASPAASETPTPTPVAIPDEARRTVWRSDTPASRVFELADATASPALAAKRTNDYTVEVETSVGLDPRAVALQVQATLDDPRGWAGYGRNNFRLVRDPKGADLAIVLASPATVDELCGVQRTGGLWDCRVKDKVVLNSDRWQYMVPTFNNLDEFRAYQVNHQVGKWLGQRLAFCTEAGAPAPVMMEQGLDLGGCLPNAWPAVSPSAGR